MLRTILFYPGIILSLIIAPLALIKVKYLEHKGKDKERTEAIFKITSSWARYVMWLSGAKVKVFGEENIPKDEAVLFVGNHQSNFDIPLIMSSIKVPKGFIAKKELEKWPGISMWMRYIRCVFMDRSNMRKSAEAIVQGIQTLKSGYSMVIFPEGTRSKGKAVAEFKAGSFKLALKSKVKIVPFTINGSYKLLEANGGKIKPSTVEIYIHKPIDTTKLSKEEISELHTTVRNIVVSDLPKEQQ
ncbi:lysophospholipid acyltransferase family protein [Clostridium sp. Ade.TY]|uniref:lysophospholipid acyltransferase family protein n=1 Tax=Clostridium sp. Ade.TY TaxID=1391647 RepID=UPI00041A0B8A|nr:lysophospholipid acyltransferase family protein [Clostridium sp. Ade.TY]